MKKISILFLCGSFAIALYSCDGDEGDESPEIPVDVSHFYTSRCRVVPGHPLQESDSEDDSEWVLPGGGKEEVQDREQCDREQDAREREAELSTFPGSPLPPEVAALLAKSWDEQEANRDVLRAARRQGAVGLHVSPSPEVRVPSQNDAGWAAVQDEDREMERVEAEVVVLLPGRPVHDERADTPVQPHHRKKFSGEGEFARLYAARLSPAGIVAGAWNPSDIPHAEQDDDNTGEWS